MLAFSGSRRLRAFNLACIALCVARAGGASAPVEETRRWVPAFAIVGGLIGQESSATASSSVRPFAAGDQLMIAPFAGGAFEIMTPRVAAGFAQPRFFAHADISFSFGFDYDVAKEGTPGALVPPTQPTQESAVPGQGSVTSAELELLVVTAGAGLAFTLEGFGQRFRIKPSFEYLREEIEVKGQVSRAMALSTGPTTDYRLIEMSGRDSKTYHGIGPGLELEMDTRRAGPFMLTLFLSGQAYHLLGDREIAFSSSYSDAIGTESATWTFEPDPWAFRGSVGLRFRWIPD